MGSCFIYGVFGSARVAVGSFGVMGIAGAMYFMIKGEEMPDLSDMRRDEGQAVPWVTIGICIIVVLVMVLLFKGLGVLH